MQTPMILFTRAVFTSLVAACLVVGCATPETSPVASTYDMGGLRTDVLTGNLLPSPTEPPREVVYFNASRVYKHWNDSSYYLEVTYIARAESGLLDIPYGETLTIVLDNETLKFRGSGSSNTREKSAKGLVTEKAIYEATREQLQKIATAKKIEVRIKGNNGSVIREFGQENFEKFRLFVITYAG